MRLSCHTHKRCTTPPKHIKESVDGHALDGHAQVIDDEKEDLGQMAHAYKLTWIWAITLSIVIFVLWPLLALPAGIFSRGYFTFWVILSMVRSRMLFMPNDTYQVIHHAS